MPTSLTKASPVVRWSKQIAYLLLVFSLVEVARANEPWVTLKDGHYLPNPANDGDSFHIRAGGKEYIFRLYFVDAPETETSVPERVADQAKYFGLTVPQTLRLGKEAQKFSRERLAHPFVVRTCMEDARGRSRLPRYFAFIQTQSDDLAEELIVNGLARIYGAASTPSGMDCAAAEWQKLAELESKAKEEKVGGWGATLGRLGTRAHKRAGSDDFAAIFHKEKVEPAAAPPPVAPVGALPAPEAKLDINHATAEELQALPGIGELLAARIIAARPFKSANDLRSVKGIGPKKYEKLRASFK